ncbi:MAG: hypothetical protein CV089_11875 [Nitrospira sp. WS110]|nr:hypothetical protein [Nitrospira sp. WS110]
MAKRPAPVPRHLATHHQSITPATRFRRLPVWVSKADIIAYFKLSPTDAKQDSASRRCLTLFQCHRMCYLAQLRSIPTLQRAPS